MAPDVGALQSRVAALEEEVATVMAQVGWTLQQLNPSIACQGVPPAAPAVLMGA